MKYLTCLLIILSSFICLNLPAQTANNPVQSSIVSDTFSGSSNNEMNDVENDFAPGLFFMLIFGVILIFLCIGAGIVLTIFLIIAFFALLSLGFLSISVVVAINKQSFTQGFKVFVWTLTTLFATATLTVGTGVLNHIFHWWSIETALTIGAISGFISGLLLGYILTLIIQKLTQILKSRFGTP